MSIGPKDPTPTNLAGWQPLLIFAIVYTLILCIIVAIRAESTTDFRDYWETALHFRQTGQISTEHGVHNYLPFFTIFMLPWSFLPLRVAIVLYTLLAMSLVSLCIILVEGMLVGWLPSKPRRATLIAVGLMLAYFHSAAVLGAINLLVLFLIIATWFFFESRREWLAGLTLGLAILIKIIPALLLLFFLLRGRWRVAAGAALITLILGLGLPLAAIGWQRTIDRHQEFRAGAAEGHAAYTTIHAEKPRKAKYSNNALPIVIRRLLTHTNADPSPQGDQLYVNLADLPRTAVWWIYVSIAATAFVLTAAFTLFPPRPWPPDSDDAVLALRAQFGAWCCLMIILSPLVWTHYLPLVYWPLALSADRAERSQRAAGRPAATTVIVLSAWLLCAFCLAIPAARAVGAQMLSVLALWIGMLLLTTRRPQPDNPPNLPPAT